MASWLQAILWRLLLLVMLASAIYWGWIYVSPWANQPIRQVVLQGDIPRGEQQLLIAQLQGRDLGRFFSVNLNQVKANINETMSSTNLLNNIIKES